MPADPSPTPVRLEPARPLDPYEKAKFDPLADQLRHPVTERRWPLTDPFEEAAS